MKQVLVIGVALLWLMQGSAQSRSDETSFIERSRTYLLAGVTEQRDIAPLLQTDSAGRWSDIDYNSNQPGVWQVADHIRRIRTLAEVWSKPGNIYYHDAAVKQVVIKALADWTNHRYRNKNWWHNEIGIPQIARDILVLMKDSLPPVTAQQTLSILAQYKLAGTGANLIWSADLGLYYGAFTHNAALMQQCRDTILSVVAVSTAEGMQPDYSYHQHGHRLQIYHYGTTFLRDNVRLAWELQGTTWAFPKEKLQLLADFLFKGWQWMARGINTVPGTIDRAVSRQDGLHSADVRALIPYCIELMPDSTAALQRLLAIQNGEGSLTGYRYYPYSDFTAYHQPGFSFFLKTNSTRTLLTESINEENLKGKLLHAGDAYFIANGNEYYNLQPCWNWDELPGITNWNSFGQTIQRQEYTGNVSDGTCGLAAMDYVLQDERKSLHVKKYWASYKGVVVALIAGVPTNRAAYTVMDQCRWQTPITINKPGDTMPSGGRAYSQLRWLHHNQFAYLPLQPDMVSVMALRNKKGSWTDINRSQPAGIVRDNVFTVQLVHLKALTKAKATVSTKANTNTSVPANTKINTKADTKSNTKVNAQADTLTNTGYVVAYAPTAKTADSIAGKPNWEVLSNDTLCQAVRFDKQVVMVAWHAAGKRAGIEVAQPCLLLVSNKNVYISDPKHVGGLFSGMVQGKRFSVQVPADGSTVQVP